jgi:neutral ceramidase
VPGEMTSEMGRRLRRSVLDASAGSGVTTAVIAGLANEYADYFTTPEEYDAQHYEGGATIYGRASSVALQEALDALAGTLAKGQAAPKPYAYDPTNGVPAAGDPFPSGAASGKITKQPPASAARLGHPALEWQGGERGFDRPLDKAFVSVQRQVTVKLKPRPAKKPRKHRRRRHRGGRSSPQFTGKVRAARTVKRWRTVDSDLGLAILWTVDSGGAYRAHWEVPLDAHAGRYRFVITANRYGLKSRPFNVHASHALTAEPLNAGAGFVALQLRYPAANSREAVGDPPGDFTADLTERPEVASSGLATFSVNGRSVTVSEGDGGVFTAPAPAGATVKVSPGDVRDEFGNANGNSLTLTP